MDKKNFLLFIVCFSLCFLAGIIASFPVSANYIWYETLLISNINPPSWIFGPIWGVLYLLMAISVWLVARKRKTRFYWLALILFTVQLILNVLWTYIFFGLMNPKAAYIELLILDIFVLLTVTIFGKISRSAQWIMLPYVIWLGFATYLNWYVMYYN
ncbi:MAG: tryptophan-rich sensory protein [Deferribacterales bacterium]|nr:tryptophan-rich sensory protein [Deferribacterales bacterium]